MTVLGHDRDRPERGGGTQNRSDIMRIGDLVEYENQGLLFGVGEDFGQPDVLERFAFDDHALVRRVARHQSPEIGRLASSFRTMLASLAGSKAQQRQLVQDASHELRTPLTSLRTNIEVLRRYDDLSPASRAGLLADLEAEARELTVLVDELVELAAEARDEEPEQEVALAEVARVLAPRGRMYLQVPVLQGRTAPPGAPEFHGDDTPVFWRFGYDLTARLRDHGFTATALVPEAWADLVRGGATAWPDGEVSPEFDVSSMLAGCDPADLTCVADRAEAARIGTVPAYMHVTWEAVKPA